MYHLEVNKHTKTLTYTYFPAMYLLYIRTKKAMWVHDNQNTPVKVWGHVNKSISYLPFDLLGTFQNVLHSML